MNDSTWTIAKVIAWATKDFKEKGFESPRLEAELLLAFVLDLSRIELYTGFERPLVPRELEVFRSCIQRRRSGEPSAYITGEKEFWSLNFVVNEHVLIPRPDTETLVSCALEQGGEGPLLDLCTGSGCIAVALASELETTTVHATDISPEALSVAAQNVKVHSLEDRVSLFEGDLFAACPVGEKYATIVSNPPYVTPEQYETVSLEVKREPRGALVSGEDGLDAVRRILTGARDHLLPGGVIALEIDPAQAEMVASQLGPEFLGAEGNVQKDLAGRARVVYWKHAWLGK